MYKVHIKNNHFAPDTFPNTAEGEEVFTITPERFELVAKDYPEAASQMDVFFDWDTDNFVSSMAEAEVLICWNLPIENLATVAPKLKWIHIIGAGVEHLTPMTWLPEGVTLTNNKGVHAAKGGEFGMMSILMLHNHMPAIVSNQTTATYDSIYSTPIAGKVVVVIGVGSIGKSVAAHAQKMGLHVIGVTRHGNIIPEVDEMFAVSELDAVLPRADFVFVVTPLTEDTRDLLDRRRLELLKKGAGLVNIGRAAVVDYDALVDKLNDGSVSGAILDVFDPEPLPENSRFWKVKNLIVTPHISADDDNAYVPMTLKVVFENMQRMIKNEVLQNQVNTELGY
ncbi:MAG: D-2-hydroxyacid dehydrogenase [Gammaproteobacteria bacterium]|nr:D-2-hydroxyacid dehydrogenase [Gammaproteobacteria bacterium]